MHRVILWGPGQIGIGALRALIQHPGLQLAGLIVHSESKKGTDAGPLCGLPETGIAATRDIDEALAVDADVVAYFASGDRRSLEAADDIARCLRAGRSHPELGRPRQRRPTVGSSGRSSGGSGSSSPAPSRVFRVPPIVRSRA